MLELACGDGEGRGKVRGGGGGGVRLIRMRAKTSLRDLGEK